MSLLGCVVGNEVGKVDGGQCTEEFERPSEEARCHSVCRVLISQSHNTVCVYEYTPGQQ